MPELMGKITPDLIMVSTTMAVLTVTTMRVTTMVTEIVAVITVTTMAALTMAMGIPEGTMAMVTVETICLI